MTKELVTINNLRSQTYTSAREPLSQMFKFQDGGQCRDEKVIGKLNAAFHNGTWTWLGLGEVCIYMCACVWCVCVCVCMCVCDRCV